MLLSKEEAWYGLCIKCKKDLTNGAGEPVSRCELCGKPLISEIDRCLPCRKNAEAEPPSYDRLISLFPYIGKYYKLLGAFKFRRSLGAGHFLAEQLIKSLDSLSLDKNEKTVLIPVPPRKGKIRKTGWDQIVSLSKLIIKNVSQETQSCVSGDTNNIDGPAYKKLQVYPCLKRQTSLTQKKLDRKDRKTNLKGRIITYRKVPKTCILFDDVITTGSTMNACAAALKQAGAEKVYGICLFYD